MSSTDGGPMSAITPSRLIGTCIFYYEQILMMKMAKILHNEEDIALFQAMSEVTKNAINAHYFKADEGIYASGSQASNGLPLYLDIVPEQFRDEVLQNLVADITINHDTHLTTGNICTRPLAELLFEEGYQDIGFKLLSQTTYPSWGYMIVNGATTIWERWEKLEEGSAVARMASQSHPMNSSAGITHFKQLAGIRPDATQPGFKNIIFNPCIPEKLDWLKADLETIRGTIHSEWKRSGELLNWEVTVPFNCTGEIHLPKGWIYIECMQANLKEETIDKKCLKVGSGHYKIELRKDDTRTSN